MIGTLDKHKAELSNLARISGESAARNLFRKLGNHSEAHLSEYELAVLCAVAVEVALSRQKEKP